MTMLERAVIEVGDQQLVDGDIVEVTNLFHRSDGTLASYVAKILNPAPGQDRWVVVEPDKQEPTP